MLLFGRHGKMIRHEVNILRPLRGGGTGQVSVYMLKSWFQRRALMNCDCNMRNIGSNLVTSYIIL